MKKLLKNFILLFLLIAITKGVVAQKGYYIGTYGAFQHTLLGNIDDFIYYNGEVKYHSTYHPAFGLRYIYNSNNIFGFETGLKYSALGQKYSGLLDTFKWNSEITFNYYSVPLMVGFNSTLDDEEDDNMFLTISVGLQVDFLGNVKMMTNPAPVIPDSLQINIYDLYHKSGASFLSSAIFNYMLNKNWYLTGGFYMSRTISSIETLNEKYPLKKYHPKEYFYPVSVKKVTVPKYFTDNAFDIRKSSKHNVYSLQIGINYRFKE